MPNTQSKYRIKFNLLLSAKDDDMLIALAAADASSKARLCRRLIQGAYNMLHHHQPTCADSTACRCPHAHVYSPSAPIPPDPDRPQ